LELEHVSYEIHPEYKPEGDVVEDRFPGYGQLIERLKVQGAAYGCHFEKVSILSNTHKAMMVGELANELGKSEDYLESIFYAYFHDGLNIGDLDVIMEITNRLGISSEQVMNALKNENYFENLKKNKGESVKLGINSVPTFIIDDKYILIGAQPPNEFEKVFNKLNEKGR